MAKAVFISRHLSHNFGGAVVGQRNYKLLKTLFQDCVTINFSNRYEISESNIYLKAPSSNIGTAVSALFGFVGGLSIRNYIKIKNLIFDQNPDYLFFDGSYYGVLQRWVNKNLKNTKIIVYYHNIEKLFIKDFISTNGLIYYCLLPAVIRNEKLASMFSKYRICMTLKDSYSLKKIYSVECNSIIPVTVDNEIVSINSNDCKGNIRLLFVGSYFFANIEGIKNFCKEILPKVNCFLRIVGNNMEKLVLPKNLNNVEKYGRVDSLKEHYEWSDVVIAPINLGSGMKVKVAEALMFGKVVIGSSNALVGYEKITSPYLIKCNSNEEFVDKINSIDRNNLPSTEQIQRIFEENFSFESALNIFREILNCENSI